MMNGTSDITAQNPPLRGGGGEYRRLTGRRAKQNAGGICRVSRLMFHPTIADGQCGAMGQKCPTNGPRISPEREKREQRSWRYAGCAWPLPMRGVVGPYQLKHPNTQTLKPFLTTID